MGTYFQFKWHHMNLIEDHPETEILQNPVWCLSKDKIIGFDKYLYSWDTQNGEFLRKKKLPYQGIGWTRSQRTRRVNPCTSLIFSDIKYRLTNEKQINVRFIITSFIWPEIIIRKSFRYFQSGTFYVIFIHRWFGLWSSRNNCRPMSTSNLSQVSTDYSAS